MPDLEFRRIRRRMRLREDRPSELGDTGIVDRSRFCSRAFLAGFRRACHDGLQNELMPNASGSRRRNARKRQTAPGTKDEQPRRIVRIKCNLMMTAIFAPDNALVLHNRESGRLCAGRRQQRSRISRSIRRSPVTTSVQGFAPSTLRGRLYFQDVKERVSTSFRGAETRPDDARLPSGRERAQGMPGAGCTLAPRRESIQVHPRASNLRARQTRQISDFRCGLLHNRNLRISSVSHLGCLLLGSRLRISLQNQC
jgi:hypothetical protein